MNIYNNNNITTVDDDNLINYLNNELTTLNGNIYYGFPLIILNDNITLMKAIIVCNSGIFIFYKTNDEMKNYKRYMNIIVNESQVIYDFYEDNENLINYCLYEEPSAPR